MDFHLSKDRFEDYTEAEFMLLLREFFEDTNGLKGAALEAPERQPNGSRAKAS